MRQVDRQKKGGGGGERENKTENIFLPLNHWIPEFKTIAPSLPHHIPPNYIIHFNLIQDQRGIARVPWKHTSKTSSSSIQCKPLQLTGVRTEETAGFVDFLRIRICLTTAWAQIWYLLIERYNSAANCIMRTVKSVNSCITLMLERSVFSLAQNKTWLAC